MVIAEMFGGITGDRGGCEQDITEMGCCATCPASRTVSAVIRVRQLGQARW
jgi:hypothetical protein